MRKTFNLSVIVAFLLIGFSVFYYFVIFLPGKESTRIQQEEAKEQDRQQRLSICLKQASDEYRNRWNGKCKLDGKKDDCALPKDIYETLNTFYKELRDECYKRYPQ